MTTLADALADYIPIPLAEQRPGGPTMRRRQTGHDAAGNAGKPAHGQPGPCAGDSEAVMQTAAEVWLIERGYLRLTPSNLSILATGSRGGGAHGDAPGLFAHWPRCKGNPTLADIMVIPWPNDRPALLVELKPDWKPIAWQPGQREAVEAGLWHMARTVAEFRQMVLDWEDGQL